MPRILTTGVSGPLSPADSRLPLVSGWLAPAVWVRRPWPTLTGRKVRPPWRGGRPRPSDGEDWTPEAEAILLGAAGLVPTSGVARGGRVVCKMQPLPRPHAGEDGMGANAGSGDESGLQPWKQQGGEQATRRLLCATAWAPMRWKRLQRLTSSVAGGLRRRRPAEPFGGRMSLLRWRGPEAGSSNGPSAVAENALAPIHRVSAPALGSAHCSQRRRRSRLPYQGDQGSGV